MSLRCQAIATIVLIGCTCLGQGAAAQVAAQSAGSYAPAAPPPALRSAQAQGTGNAVDNAVAGALVSAISEQLGGRAVDMRLEAMDVRPLSIRDRTVSGTGSLRLQGGNDWMGFRFQVLYDSQLGSTGYPEVSIGGVAAGERTLPNDVQLVQQLDARVAAALAKEFSQQSVRLQLDTIRTVQAGSRYLRINAGGIADFGPDGSAPAQIEGLYDRTGGQWLRVHYQLGGEAKEASADVPLSQR